MRLIFNLESVGNTTVLNILQGPWVPESFAARGVQIPSDLGGNAQARGEKLIRLLYRHNAIRAALGMALAQPPASLPQPIYFRALANAADALPWELLYSSTQGFVALDSRWPLGRVARRVQKLKDRAFLPPFRVVAVLSAAARRGLPQLNALAKSVEDARARGLDVRLHVITGEQAVRDRVAAFNHKFVTVEWIAATPTGLARQITDAKPSVLHLLCHGKFAAGVRGLAFATIQDFLSEDQDAQSEPRPGDQTGSVVLGVDLLTRALSPCDPWLIVLAACNTAQVSNGAARTADNAALAHSLVDAGLPAVVGMRRLVTLGAMNRFCEALYPEVLSIVSKVVESTPGNERAEIDWALALTAPRQAAIVGIDPSLIDTWSDAVLYAQQDELVVYVSTDKSLPAEEYAAHRGRLDVYVHLRKTLNPTTTPSNILAEIDREIARIKNFLPVQSDA